MSARDVILQRITTAKGTTTIEEAAAAYLSIERLYQQEPILDRASILRLFEERLTEYDATVMHVAPAHVGLRVKERLQQRGMDRVLIPHGLPEEWLHGATFVQDEAFSAQELNQFRAVMTTATLGIAETGTIVLQNAAGQGRRALSLVPDYHLCFVHASDVVETVVEGMRLLEPTKHLPTTFFSGPSATADIEMTRIKGVHGPRFVDVFLMD